MAANHPAPLAAPSDFPPAEVAVLRTDDAAAGKHIVVLMFGIFLLGLIGYTLIDLWVAGSFGG
jgi:hypothetical protein